MKFDVVILAGGFGTRLRSVVQNVPKPMAPVAGKPFLDHVLKSLPIANVGKIVLAVGYLHEKVSAYYGASYAGVPIQYSVENDPLGTGGGIAQALEYVTSETAVILNGDTFFDVDYEAFWEVHGLSSGDITLALKQIDLPDRYGTVLLEGKQVVKFQEKQEGLKTGLINGGVYWVNQGIKEEFPSEKVFSFEADFLEKKCNEMSIGGYISTGLFIDIGIPSDYERAQDIFA